VITLSKGERPSPLNLKMGDEEAAKELAAEEAQIELFKIKRLIKSLERARGCVMLPSKV